jgi:hypothetical protein
MARKRTTMTRTARSRRSSLTARGLAVGGKLTTWGFIVLKIGDDEFTLDGYVGDFIIVSYHRSFEEALPLGTITEMLGAVAGALGVPDAPKFEKDLNDLLDNLAKIPVLGPIIKVLKEGVFKVTDLAINTQTKTYEFGFGVDTSETVDNIPIKAFGVKFTYVGT